MTVKTERRTQLRKRPLTLVYVELPPSNGGMMRDLSEHGFSLRAMLPLKPSEKVPFSFSLDTAARIDGEAIVLRLEDNGHVAALEFAGLSAYARDHIRRWLEKFEEPLSREPGPPKSQGSANPTLTELRSEIYSSPQRPATSPPGRKISPPPAPPPPAQAAPPPAEPAKPFAPPPPSAAAWVPVSSPLQEPSKPLLAPLSGPVQSVLPPPAPAQPSLPPSPLPSSAESLFPLPPAAPPELPQALPPLLKLSSVRPSPPLVEVPAEPVVPVATPMPVPVSAAPILPPSQEILSPPPDIEKTPVIALLTPPPSSRLIPPPLEPLSSFEGDTDAVSPGWMDSFTLRRVISIMLFLTLIAGSFVYHREFGRALIWLGQQIEGDDSPDISHTMQPSVPPSEPAIPDTPPTVSSAKPPVSVPPSDAIVPAPPTSSEPKSAELPRASENTPVPQLKDATPGSLVTSAQVNRSLAATPPADIAVEAGRSEYQQAMQILRSPSGNARLPEAIRLLWVAVQNGNISAEIALAELYRQGRGVTKNCDQTRILLSAAARKGSADARQRLQEFQREGCAQ